MPQSIDRLLEDLTGSVSRQYEAVVTDLLVAKIRGNRNAASEARRQLAEVITDTMGRAEVLGAMVTLQQVAQALKRMGTPGVLRADRSYLLAFAEDINPVILPSVTLMEAVEDLVERAPKTIKQAALRTGQKIAELYAQGPVIAFAKAAEETVTEKAKEVINRSIRDGIAEPNAARALAITVEQAREISEPWSRAYSQMAFRTNVNTAVTAGRFRQAKDPDVQDVAPAFLYDAVGDSSTRPNHKALDGIIMSVDNPEWKRVAPPNGYSCRCTVILMSRPELAARGRLNQDGTVKEDRVPAGAGPDPGFRKGPRPDLPTFGSG